MRLAQSLIMCAKESSWSAPRTCAWVAVLAIWPMIAVQVKRWHHRDKTGWWVLISLVPVIGLIWSLSSSASFRVRQGQTATDPIPSLKGRLRKADLVVLFAV